MTSARPATLLLCAALFTCLLAGAEENAPCTSSPCFNRLIKPEGWQIPPHSTTSLRSGIFEDAGLPNITFTIFAVSKVFFLPHYYVEGGALNLTSLRFRAEELKRLEVNGQPFAFIAAVRGVEVGIAGSVWWVDIEGKGSFTMLAWNPDMSQLPDWVKQKAQKN